MVLRKVFIASIPVLTGYLTMGFAAGMLLALHGGVEYPTALAATTSTTYVSGLLQFLLVDWVKNGTAYVDIVVLVLCLNIRYSLYGISLLDRFKAEPWYLRLYMIGVVTDETYALQMTCPYAVGTRECKQYCFWLALFDHCYWIIGVTLGALVGATFSFEAKGIDFAMTALFIVILVDQVKVQVNRLPALIGVITAIMGTLVAYFVFDSWKMLIPTMILMVTVLLAMRSHLERKDKEVAHE